LRAQIPTEVFTKEYRPPTTDGSGELRTNLRAATKLLSDAGWTVKNKLLTGPDGKPMEIEFLLSQPEFERVVQPFARNLERLGVVLRIRTVDTAQYINRVRDFDFDMMLGSWGQSDSPGNEQRDYWSAAAADRPGSRNLAGIKNPGVDALVEAIVAAPDRPALIAASRALDRVLLWNHYVAPNWHIATDRIAYWNKFARQGAHPKYGPDLMSWWIDPAKAAQLGKPEPARN
jgi:microcin C transport system substrate-binding protein